MGFGSFFGKKDALVAPDPRGQDLASRSAAAMHAVRQSLRGSARDAALLAGPEAWTDLDENDALAAQACYLTSWRRFREAALLYERLAGSAAPTDETLIDAGWCFHAIGRPADAMMCFERVLARASHTEALLGASAVHLGQKRFDQAKECLVRIVSADPSHEDAWLSLGHAELALGNGAAAEAAARGAIRCAPTSANAWCLLARLLKMLSRDEEAFAAFTSALDFATEVEERSMVAGHLAVALVETGQQAKAIAICEGALAQAPIPFLRASYAMALLTVGRLREGWREYEYRWFQDPMRASRIRFDFPFWEGQPLEGKSILLRSEQGIGDVIQFARYAALLKARGAKVVLHAHPGMGKIAEGLTGVDEVHEKLQMPARFDYFINMMTLPRVFDTTLDCIPAQVPYLRVDTPTLDKWRPRFSGSGVRVGLVWAGNPKQLRDRDRSIPLRELAPLWSVPGVRYFSLQKELRPGDSEYLAETGNVELLGPELEDLSDTAAVIRHLDLVITVDTGVAHLAGAMGKTVWLLLAAAGDFRWLETREDSPWYPTIRLIRQERLRDWGGAVTRVRSMLEELAGDSSRLGASPALTFLAPSAANEELSAQLPVVVEAEPGILQVIPDLDDEARGLRAYGEYLPDQLDLILKLVPMDAWVLEAGAGFGSHALSMAKLLSPESNLLLYEGRNSVKRLLKQTLEANEVLDRVTFPRGCIETGGDWANDGPAHAIDHLRLPRLDLLKIRLQDPLPLLRGAERTLWAARPIVVVTDERGADLAGVIAVVRTFSYRVWRLDSPIFRENNFAGMALTAGERSVSSIFCLPEEADARCMDTLPEMH